MMDTLWGWILIELAVLFLLTSIANTPSYLRRLSYRHRKNLYWWERPIIRIVSLALGPRPWFRNRFRLRCLIKHRGRREIWWRFDGTLMLSKRCLHCGKRYDIHPASMPGLLPYKF